MKVCCEHCRHEFDADPAAGHRILVGDSTDPASVARLMRSERATLVFTSPPYGSQRDYTTGGVGDWDALMRGVFAALPVFEPAQVLVNLGLVHRDNEWQPYWQGWLNWMRERGWRRFGLYVWDQGPGMMGDWNGRLAPAFEFVFHFNRVARRPNKIVEKLPDSIEINDHGGGIRRADGAVSARSNPKASLQTHKIPDSVLRIMRHKARGIETDHPAVFPVALPEFILGAFSDPGDIVFEPFAGSGSTVLAGERSARRVMAIDIAPEYVDIAMLRWQQHTGRIAVRDDGLRFDSVAA